MLELGLGSLSRLALRYINTMRMSIKGSVRLALIVATYATNWSICANLIRSIERRDFMLKIHIDNGILRILYKCTACYRNLWVSIFEVFLKKEYELVRDYEPREGDLVVDVGAHVGLYAIYAATKAKNVIAFEPIPQNFHYLMKHIELNNLRKVTAFPLALADEEGTAEFYMVGAGLASSTSFEEHAEAYKKYYQIAGTVKARKATLDKTMRNLGIKTINLLKIDTEGAENSVLSGARLLLGMNAIHKIVVEVHKTVNRVSNITRFLRKYGYRIDAVFEESEKALVYARSLAESLILPCDWIF